VTPEEIILSCYKLAKYYGRDPDEFLAKPLSRVRRHLEWTIKLIEKENSESPDIDG